MAKSAGMIRLAIFAVGGRVAMANGRAARQPADVTNPVGVGV